LPGGGFSTVISTTGAGGYTASTVPELASFRLGGSLLSSAKATGGSLSVFSTCFGALGTNASFFVPSTLPLEGPNSDTVSLWLLPNCVVTLTTLPFGAGAPLQPPSSTPAVPTAFFGQRSDDFSKRSAGQPGEFWADVHGSFAVVDDAAAGRGLQQVAQAPRPLSPTALIALSALRPHSVLGDATWRDVDASVKFFLPTQGDCAGLGLRVSSFNVSGLGALGAADGSGVWVGVCAATSSSGVAGNSSGSGGARRRGGWSTGAPTGNWLVFESLDRSVEPVAEGVMVQPMLPGTWHLLRLVLRGDSAVCLIDGELLARVDVPVSRGFPSLGFMGLAVADFGSSTVFGPYLVTALGTTCSATPREGDEPRLEPCQGGTPGQSLFFSGIPGVLGDPATAAGTAGAIKLEFNSSLCLQMENASSPDVGYGRTKRLWLAQCVDGEPRQQFTIEASAADGGDGVVGPIQGVDGLTINIFSWGEADDTPIRGYPCQGTSNSIWQWDAITNSIYAIYEGLCFSFCEKE